MLFRSDGAYLVGEAAGFISPSSLEGISSAILSATALAESLEQSRPLAAYRRATGHLRWKLLAKNLKCPFMYHPFLRSLVLKSGLTSIQVEARPRGTPEAKMPPDRRPNPKRKT